MEKGNMPIETDLNDLKETDSLKAKEKDNAINYKEELINEKVEQNNFGRMHGGITQREMVVQMDLNGNTIKEFESVSAAAQELNCHYQAISQCASGKIKTCCGYRWKYLNK